MIYVYLNINHDSNDMRVRQIEQPQKHLRNFNRLHVYLYPTISTRQHHHAV